MIRMSNVNFNTFSINSQFTGDKTYFYQLLLLKIVVMTTVDEDNTKRAVSGMLVCNWTIIDKLHSQTKNIFHPNTQYHSCKEYFMIQRILNYFPHERILLRFWHIIFNEYLYTNMARLSQYYF